MTPSNHAFPVNDNAFHALVEQSLAGIYVIQDGDFRFANARLLEIFGCHLEDVQGSFNDFLAWAVAEEDRAVVKENIRRRLSGEVRGVRYDIHCLKKDGTPINVEVHGSLAEYEGRPAIVGILLDVTARHTVEQALTREHAFISTVLDTVGALVVVLDRQGRVVRFNHACEMATGYQAHEIIGRNIWDRLLPPEESEAVQAVFGRLVAGDFPSRYENHWLTRNGEYRLIDWANTSLLDADGQVEFVIGTGIDITERRWAETARQESEQRYRVLFNSGHDAIFVHELRPLGRFIEVNDLACRRLGYTREELTHLSPADIDGPVTAEEQRAVVRQIEIMGHALFERTHLTKDGRAIPVEINSQVVELGGKQMALSIARDISERKLAEAALRESETKLREITSELGNGIYVLDRSGNLTFMNKAAEQMLGYSEAELLGHNAHETFHFQKSDGTRVPMSDCPVYQVTRSGETYRIHEDWFTRKDGSLFPVSFVASPLHRGSEIVGSVAAFQDIAERKQVEDLIHHMAHHDMLTGLPNRALLTDRINQTLAHARRNKAWAAILFLDLDGFKQINDSLGHDAGDVVLKTVADRLRKCVRESDTVARMGGDEFVILLADINAAEDVSGVARKLISTVNAPIPGDGHDLHVGASIGIALYPRDAEDTQTLMRLADAAMYSAKESGRNDYRFHSRPGKEVPAAV